MVATNNSYVADTYLYLCQKKSGIDLVLIYKAQLNVFNFMLFINKL